MQVMKGAGSSIEKGPLIDKVKEYLPLEKLALVEEAYCFALEAHSGQLRRSGEDMPSMYMMITLVSLSWAR